MTMTSSFVSTVPGFGVPLRVLLGFFSLIVASSSGVGRTVAASAHARTPAGRPRGTAGSSVTGDLASVDVDDFAGDEGGRLQEEDGIDHVVDLADVPERDKSLSETGVAPWGRDGGLNEARGESVD